VNEWLRALRREAHFACSLARGATVLVELPEGLRFLEGEVERLLYSCGAELVEFKLEPTYGACDTVACETGYDLVVHVGHVPYVYRPILRCGRTRIVYLPLVLDASVEEVEAIAPRLDGYSSVGLGYVVNYSKLAALLARELRRRGTRVHVSHILGCYSGRLERADVEVYVVVGSGFHALGLGLATHGEKPVLLYEPGRGLRDYTRGRAFRSTESS